MFGLQISTVFKLLISNILSLDKIVCAMPTSEDITGTFAKAHSLIALGPPSILELTIYKSKQLYNLFKVLKSPILFC